MKATTRLALVVVISICFFIAEIAIGFRTKSLALIADAFHYLNDIVAYIIAFVAAYLQDKGPDTVGFTYAFHRAELVGAFFNGVFLLALALSILLQSVERFIHVEEVNNPMQIMIVGAVGLFLNIVSVIVLGHAHGEGGGHSHGGHSHSAGGGHGHGHGNGGEAPASTPVDDPLHAQHHHTLFPPTAIRQQNLGTLAVLIHLFGDAVNNVGVIITGVLIWKLHSPSRFYADPAVSLAISLIIFASAVPMTIRTGRILLETAPVELDLEKVREDLLAHDLVRSVHDMHVWVLSQKVTLASLHVCVPRGTSLEAWERTERGLQHCFEAYGVNHVTISPEVYRGQSGHGDPGSSSGSDDETLMMCHSASVEGPGCAVASPPVLRRRAATDRV